MLWVLVAGSCFFCQNFFSYLELLTHLLTEALRTGNDCRHDEPRVVELARGWNWEAQDHVSWPTSVRIGSVGCLCINEATGYKMVASSKVEHDDKWSICTSLAACMDVVKADCRSLNSLDLVLLNDCAGLRLLPPAAKLGFGLYTVAAIGRESGSESLSRRYGRCCRWTLLLGCSNQNAPRPSLSPPLACKPPTKVELPCTFMTSLPVILTSNYKCWIPGRLQEVCKLQAAVSTRVIVRKGGTIPCHNLTHLVIFCYLFWIWIANNTTFFLEMSNLMVMKFLFFW